MELDDQSTQPEPNIKILIDIHIHEKSLSPCEIVIGNRPKAPINLLPNLVKERPNKSENSRTSPI